jgi:threonine aldolase
LPQRMDFASDNTSGIAPEVMAALARANHGFSASYGADETTARASDCIRNLLDVDAEVFFGTSGTAANALCLASICRPCDSVLAHKHSHIMREETGAPAFFGHGLAVTGLGGPSGRLAMSELESSLAAPDSAHRQCPGALALTNATEYGTIYSVEAMVQLLGLARHYGIAQHIDGARLANAAAAGFDLKALGRLGVDTIVLGGTKAGMWQSEAIVIPNKAISHRFSARLKQGGQLSSKSRFSGASWIEMIESGAWLEYARHANAMARKLADIMQFDLAHPVETNAVFVNMDAASHRLLSDIGWETFRFADGSVRFMCSWSTTERQIEEIATDLAKIG